MVSGLGPLLAQNPLDIYPHLSCIPIRNSDPDTHDFQVWSPWPKSWTAHRPIYTSYKLSKQIGMYPLQSLHSIWDECCCVDSPLRYQGVSLIRVLACRFDQNRFLILCLPWIHAPSQKSDPKVRVQIFRSEPPPPSNFLNLRLWSLKPTRNATQGVDALWANLPEHPTNLQDIAQL